ncbi:unnamed protein product [Closterium sp. NIES-65]|nr:unnamed protein product [Closterium sp. NIES-65]
MLSPPFVSSPSSSPLKAGRVVSAQGLRLETLEERSRRKAFILERGLLDPRRVDGTIRPESTTGSRGRVRDRDRTDEQHKREDGAEQGGEREGGTLGEVGAEAGESGVEKGEGGGKRGGKRGGGGERRRSKEEREMFLRCRVFARFLSAEEHEGLEHEGLVQSLMQAQRLRDRVVVLQVRAAGAEWGWCRVGLLQSGAGAKWGWYRVGLVQSGAGAEFDPGTEAELRAAGCKSLAEGRRFIQAHYKDNPVAAAAAIACLPPSATGGVCTLRHSIPLVLQPSATFPRTLFVLLPLAPPAISTASSGGASAALDISSHPGRDLLSAKERELCTHMRLLPAHYLLAKQSSGYFAAGSLLRGDHLTSSSAPTLPPALCHHWWHVPCVFSLHPPFPSPPSQQVILQQAALSGGTISRAAVHRLFRLPPDTTDAIFRLLLGAGWIAEAGGNNSGGGMGGAMGGGMVKQEGM